MGLQSESQISLSLTHPKKQDGEANTKQIFYLNMSNWIKQFIAFLRFVFTGKVPKAPQPTVICDDEYKVGGLFTFEDGTTQVVGEVQDNTFPETAQIVSREEHDKSVLAERIVNYMFKKNYFVDTNPENGNIVYVSGMHDMFAFRQENKVDEWDDMRLIVKFNHDGVPMIDFWQAASCEPGTISRKSAAAKKLGGVATVMPGQYKAWKMGFHKHDFDHPALIQCADVVIWRDANQNEIFDDMVFKGIYGINQHSTKPGFSGPKVGVWSAGCLVGKDFAQHLQFIAKLKDWKVCKDDSDHVFTTTIIPGKSLFNESPNNA